MLENRPDGEVCSVVNSTGERCSNIVRTNKVCNTHYHRQWRTGDVQADIPIKAKRPDGSGWIDRGYKLVARNGRRTYEHRFVMEEILGRELLPEENVHHKNGDRADNRPENLELWTTSQPNGQRAIDKLAWAREIIKLYEGKIF
jgi:hypothetical protein